MENIVKSIIVRTSYKDENPIFKTDKEGVLISFGEKNTNEVVKEMIILYNPDLELKEVHKLLKKVFNQIESKL